MNKCKQCKKLFEPKYSTTQQVCSIECSKLFSRSVKGKKLQEKLNKERTSEQKEKIKTTADWKRELQPLINKIARLIDFGQPCIATGSYNGKKNGGHRMAIGANETLRFHLDNIHIQSEHSNSWKAGDNYRYSQGIKNVYGAWYLHYLDTLNQIQPIKLTSEQIKDAISICRGIIKELEAEPKVRTPQERIELRKELNKRIGIYN
jgi:Bacteriophage Lambda NinG protein